jgi:tetratricopeptide (TPR) repeat protein
MITRPVLVLAACAALSGCGKTVITDHQREEAANMVSEADFAVTVREWSRAEGLYKSAVAECPDSGDTWVSLGIARMHLEDHSGAKSAYKSSLKAYKASFEADPTNSEPVLREAYVLVLLGRADEARSAVARAYKDHPDDRGLRSFSEGDLDKMISDPGLKAITP